MYLLFLLRQFLPAASRNLTTSLSLVVFSLSTDLPLYLIYVRISTQPLVALSLGLLAPFLVVVTKLVMNCPSSSRGATMGSFKSPSDHSASKSNQAENEDHDTINKSKESFGLFRLNLDDCVSSIRNFEVTTETFNADIIAIHGLGGTAFKTWTHRNGKNWLSDFAPSEFPGARIYTFGYDSGFAFSRGTGTLNDFARSFLEAVKLERSSPIRYYSNLFPRPKIRLIRSFAATSSSGARMSQHGWHICKIGYIPRNSLYWTPHADTNQPGDYYGQCVK